MTKKYIELRADNINHFKQYYQSIMLAFIKYSKELRKLDDLK